MAGDKNATKYAEWTAQVTAALKAHDPLLKVTVPVHHHWDTHWNPAIAAFSPRYFDAVSMHPCAYDVVVYTLCARFEHCCA